MTPTTNYWDITRQLIHINIDTRDGPINILWWKNHNIWHVYQSSRRWPDKLLLLEESFMFQCTLKCCATCGMHIRHIPNTIRLCFHFSIYTFSFLHCYLQLFLLIYLNFTSLLTATCQKLRITMHVSNSSILQAVQEWE